MIANACSQIAVEKALPQLITCMLINFKLTYMSVVSLSSGEKGVFTGEITLHTKIKTIAVKQIMTTAKELMIILKNQVHLSELSASTFLLPSIPYNTSRQAKLWKVNVNPELTVDFLVNHSQKVYHQATLSSSRSISTGSPQGIVLSPILFTRNSLRQQAEF